MPFVAILGAGPLGGALTYSLACRNRFDEVRLVDPAGTVAEGKALDVRQSGPADGWSTRVSGHAALTAAAGAWVVVLCDVPGDPVHVLRTVLPAAPGAVVVCADTSHGPLLRTLVGQGLASPDLLIGSAPSAACSGARALVAAACDVAPADVFVSLTERADGPGFQLDWARVSLCGEPAAEALARERRDHLDALFGRSWPPGPLLLASAAARIAEAAWFGSRLRFPVWLPMRPPASDRAARRQKTPAEDHARGAPFLAEVRFDSGGRCSRSDSWH